MNFTVNGEQVDLLGEAIQISNLEQIQPGDQVLDEIIINNPTTVTTDSGDIQFILNSDLDAAEELIQAEEVADQGGPKGVKVELEYNLDGIMGSDLPNVANYGVQPQYNNVQVEIIEQPAPNKLRFRYECEGRAAGALTGASSTHDNRTFPTIKVHGYQGPAVVVVSCVTDKEPYKAHPHNLVGKQLCKKGVCSQEVNVADMTAVFTHLGIQCVKKKDAAASLKTREEIRVDPFKQGFAHASSGQYNLNQVRLCFQVFLRQPNGLTPVDPVVSDVIYDAKAHKDLNIVNYSDNCAPIEGGKKILLFCEKISRDDIEIRFSYTDKNGQSQILKGHFTPNDVHHQVGISFTTPAFPDQKITEKVPASMYLFKVSNGATSNEVDFYFEPSVEINNFVQPAPVPQRAGNLKRNKAAARGSNNQEEESDSSRLAKPAQKKNANLANSGGCMVIKPEVDEGAAGGGYIDRLLQVTEPMANNRASATISQKDLEELITNKKSTEIFDIDIPSDQILSDPGKILNPDIFDELSDSMQRTGISDNKSKPKQNSQLDTPDVSMEQSKSSRMNNLNK